MRVLVPSLCVLCAALVQGLFDGTCPRKEPPPGVLILGPGSKLVLTCGGHVEVNGVKVNMARNSSNTNRGRPSDAASTRKISKISNTGASLKSDTLTVNEEYDFNTPGGNRSLRHTAPTASPTTHTVRITRALKGDYDWEAGEMDGDDEYEDEDEGGRVTRGIKSKLHWKWNGRTVGKGDRDWGEITLDGRGAALTMSSVRPGDSGRYTCYHRGRERFSLKVNVLEPPERPVLSCYKRAPNHKIRCEWAPQKPLSVTPNCYLFHSKSPTDTFLRMQCSYSPRRSRCWCALGHSEDELRTLYMAYLCVTSIAGNATSDLSHFTPLSILKPDPPSNVSVRQEEGHGRRMTVTWGFPISWKSDYRYYELIYELKYRPLKSVLHHGQLQMIRYQRSYTITDAMPGVEYLIQLRTKEEYDGLWSDWSTPVYASSWLSTTAKVPVELWNDDLSAPTFPVYTDNEGSSGTDENVFEEPETVKSGAEVINHVLWISGLFALLSLILAVYIFRHKDRFMSKLLSVTQCGDSAQPFPEPPEGQALVTFGPPRFKEPPASEVKEREEEENEEEEDKEEEEEEEEEEQLKERLEAIHFNNTSYFFLHMEE